MSLKQTTEIDAWALEWLVGAAKRDLLTRENPGERHWLREAIKRGERAYAKWCSLPGPEESK